MPVLSAFLLSIFGGFFSLFVKVFAARAAFAAAGVAGFAALTLGLYAAFAALFASLTAAFPDVPGVSVGVWFVTPDVLPACIGACLAADGLAALYRWNTETLRFATR